MERVNFEDELGRIIAQDARYPREAYIFVREALDHTQQLIGKAPKSGIRHVTGQQLLEGIRDYALRQFGPMTITVFSEWGIQRCEDFGEIVFNLVENNVLAKTPQDSRDDFKGGYDFDEAFRRPFLPKAKLARQTEASRTA